MSASKHTPGPWRAEFGNNNATVVAGLEHHLAEVRTLRSTDAEVDGNRDVMIANARLIAAAPDMLAALREAAPFLEILAQAGNIWAERGAARARAAIAKAGEERRLLAEGKLRGFIPWAMIAPHEDQALRNHHQPLERIAESGGLYPLEAVHVLKDRPAGDLFIPKGEARAVLEVLVQAWSDQALHLRPIDQPVDATDLSFEPPPPWESKCPHGAEPGEGYTFEQACERCAWASFRKDVLERLSRIGDLLAVSVKP